MNVPSEQEFLDGIRLYESNEKRDAMYKVSNFLVTYFWGKAGEMADALGVLLLTWNQAFYRYGSFDFDKLEAVISKNLPVLTAFRARDITTLTLPDESSIKNIFLEFREALQIESVCE